MASLEMTALLDLKDGLRFCYLYADVDRYIILTTILALSSHTWCCLIIPWRSTFIRSVTYNTCTTVSTQVSRPRPELQWEFPTGHGLYDFNGGNVGG